MSTKEMTTVRPRVDVFESAAEYLVVADVPGVVKDGVDVQFENGQLTLRGRREAAPTQNDQATLTQEQRLASYERAFAMPDDVDAEKISAKLANGVLEVHLPKQAAKQPRKIEVRVS